MDFFESFNRFYVKWSWQMGIRNKSVLTMFVASFLGTSFLWNFNIFYILKDWSRYMDGFLVFFFVVTILVFAACLLLFFQLRPIHRMEKKLKKGEFLNEEEDSQVGKIRDSLPLIISLINLVGFILGPLSKQVISALLRGHNPFHLGMLTSVIYSVGIGFYVAFIEIRLIEGYFFPIQKMRKRTEIEQTKKRRWASRQFLMGATLLLLSGSLFFSAGMGFVKKELTAPANITDSVSSATQVQDTRINLWSKALSGESLQLDWNSGEIQGSLIQYTWKMTLLAFIILILSWFALRIETIPTENRLKELNQRLAEMSTGEAHRDNKLIIIRGDELGETVHWINRYTDKQYETIETISNSIESLGSISKELEVMNQKASVLGSRVDEGIKNVVESLGLQHRVLGEVEDDAKKLEASIGKTSHNLAEQTQAMVTSSAAVEEMVASIGSVAKNAQRAFQGTQLLRTKAKSSSGEMTDLLEGIQEIVQAAEEVHQNIGQISKLAAQTNMLAMNAAIEAAHAGRAGAGFAVVAAEVRSLAENSSKTAKGITDLIKRMNDLSSSGLNLTSKAQKSFEEINQEVSNNAELISEISQAMSEQDAGSRNVQDAMSCFQDLTGQVRDITEDQNEQSQHVRASITQLNKAAENIQSQMDQNVLVIQDLETFVSSLGNIISRNFSTVKALENISIQQIDPAE